MVGVFVELMAVLVEPENPFVLAVLKTPSIVAVPEVPKVIAVVPASMVEPFDTVNDFELARVTVRLLVFNNEPELTSPTVIFPITLVAEIAAPKVAPDSFVLLILIFV